MAIKKTTTKKTTSARKPAAKTAAKRTSKTGIELAREKRAQQAAERRAEIEKRHAALEKELASVAKSANAAIEKAAVAEGRADDLRLTAAQHIATARQRCKEENYTFKRWVENNITFSVEEATRLAKIGSAEDPKAALVDFRAQKAAAQKARRDASKVKSRAKKSGSSSTSTRAVTGTEAVTSSLASMTDNGARNLLESEAAKRDLRVVEADAAAQANSALKIVQSPNPVSLMGLFKQMSAADQQEFLAEAQAFVGNVVSARVAKEVDLDKDMPDFLRKNKTAETEAEKPAPRRRRAKGTGKAVGEAVRK